MKRIALVFVAACATPVSRPAATTPVASVEAEPAPRGMFVPDLMSHRIGSAVVEQPMLDVALAGAPQFGGPAARGMILFAPASAPVRHRELVVRQRRDAAAEEPTTIQYCIDENGHVTWVHADGPTAPGQLDAIRAWRFAPYFVDGRPLAVCSFTREPNGTASVSAAHPLISGR